MSTRIRNFRDLEVWKLGKDLVVEVYRATKEFPKEEQYGLVAQMRGAAVSIPSNIAEGFNRVHNKEYRQFLYMALGSCAERETNLELSCEVKFLSPKVRDDLLDKIDHETRMLRNLIKKLT